MIRGADPRIVLVTMTEEDIRELGRWPLTDDVLAQALESSAGTVRARSASIYIGTPGTARTRQAECNLNQQSPHHRNDEICR